MRNFLQNLKQISIRLGHSLDSNLSRFCLASLILMSVGVGQAWGKEWKWEITVGVSEGRGTVYAKIQQQVAIWYDEKTSDDATYGDSKTITVTTNKVLATSNSNRRGKVYLKSVNDGYSFDGWYNTSGTKLGSGNECSAFSSTNSGATVTINAKFTPVTVSSAGSASTSFNHPMTDSVILYFPVSNNADADADFNAPTITANTGWSIKSWKLNTSTHKVKVVCEFTANSNVTKGTYTATVTLKAKSNESNTGTVTANVDLTPTLTYNNGTVDVSISDADKTTLNVANLKTAYKGADNVAGDGTITYALKTANSNVSLTSAGVFYAKATGTYTIVASATKGRYYAKTAEFTVTVGKRTPTFSWAKTGENDHIYAGDVLTNVAQAKYGNANVAGLTYSYSSANTGVVVVDGTTLRVQSTGFTTAQNVTISVSTEETAYYLEGSGSHTYYIEPKQTPEFYMNSEEIPAGGAELHLLIGETANFSFDKVDESKFSTPKNPQYVSYVHNSTNHTGVLTATAAGDEYIQFSQTGTNLINAGSRSVHVYVSRHPVNLAKALSNGTWKVDSVYTGAVYSITNGDGVHALNTVNVTSSDESVLKYEDGGWKAVGEGNAKLIISHANTNYWAAEKDTVEITVEKYTPEFTWHLPATVNWNRAFANPVSSTNTMEGCTFSFSSNNTSAINWTNNALRTFEKNANNVGITVTQAGNYKWAQYDSTFYVNVEKMANHVEFTVNSQNIYNAVNGGGSGERTYDATSGIRLGGSSTLILPGQPCYNWDDKYVIINFEGIPDKLSFQYRTNKSDATGAEWFVKESADGANWSDNKWSNTRSATSYETVSDIQLSPNTRYLLLCYSGNFAGYYKDVKITERTEINGVNSVDFGTTDASSNATNRTINIDWYNVNPLTLTIEGANASQFSVSPISIASAKDSYATNVPVTISYKHDRGGNDVANLVISDGVTSKTISLSGVTQKMTPSITWKENLSPLSRGEDVTNPATSPVTLTYTSTDSTVVDIEGNILKPLKKGNATITASFDGTSDPVYNSTSSTIDVQVTDMKVLHINWPQTFTRLKYSTEKPEKTTADFGLSATVSYFDPDTKEEINIERTVTYTSGDNAVVQVLSGNILHVVGVGTTTLTAHVDGIENEFIEANVVRSVKVREPSTDCDTYILEDAHNSMLTEINSFSGVETVYDLNEEPGYLTFSAWTEKWYLGKLGFDPSGDLKVAQFIDGEWSDALWSNSLQIGVEQSFGPIALDRRATKIKFYKEVGSTCYHNFSEGYVTLARYVELDNTPNKTTSNIAFTTAETKPGVAVVKTFTVNYSNITDQLQVDLTGSDKFSILSATTIGEECGDKGTATVEVQFLSNDVDHYEGTITVHNENQSVTINLSADVDKHHQQITWNPETTDLKTTDNVTFDATTTGSSAGLSVRYSVTEGTDVASVNATTGALTILKDGTVTIQANADGNETTYYDAEPVSKTFTISKVKPSITTAPAAATMTLPNTNLGACGLSNGEASVDGTFAWENESVNATYNNGGYKVVFTPSNANWYDTASCVVVVPVDKIAQVITWNFNVPEMFCNATYAFTGANAATVNNNVGTVVYETSADTIAYVDDAKNLKIVKGGTVTITARCAGNELYAAAAAVEKTFIIHRMAPTIVALPTAASMKIGRLLSDASLTGGRAELNSQKVEGAFAWVDGNTTVMDVAGTFNKQVVFTPSNLNYYEPVYDTKNVKVEKYAPVLSNNSLSGTTITYGQAVNMSTINGSITATDTVKLPHAQVAGNVVWKNASTTYPAAGDPSYATAVFVPENTDWYNEVEIANVPLTVNAVAAASYSATATIVYGQRLSEATLVNTTKGVFGELVNGSVTWAEGVDQTEVLGIDDHNVAIRFTSSSSNYIDGDGICVVTVQEGVVFKGNTDSSWGDKDNWIDGNKPGTNDRVTVDANVEITGDVTIGGLTINEDKTVIVKDGATLTIGDKSSFERDNGYGNLYVENGGKVIFGNGEVKVNNFILEASLGDNTVANPAKSGQVDGDEQLTVNGDAYFKISFDPRGAIDYGWYDFTVPFEVDVRNGVYDENGNKLTYNVDYAVMDFSEEKRAANKKYWNWFTGTLQPGQLYSITLEETKTWNTFLFKRKANTTQYGSNTYGASYTESGETDGRGWNGMGNGTLRHCQLNTLPAQTKILVYDHAHDRYVEREADEYTYAVGTAFFVQVDEAKDIDLTTVEENRAFLAPKRSRSHVDEFRLALSAEGDNNTADLMWVSASEEATGEYVIGHDLLKMGTPTQAKVAQMWCNNNGLQLCDIEMPLVNDEASCSMGLYAPKAGVYTLNIERAPEDAVLYLTYNDNIIWDLTMGAYEFDLSKGSTNGYGLRIEAKRGPQVMTGVESVEADGKSARKVFIDNAMYIVTPEGRIYNVTGKFVR